MIDARTAALVGAAVAAPWLAATLTGSARAAGVPIPVYVTAGQLAALAAVPSSVAGVSTVAGTEGDELADTRQVFARWRAWNAALLASQGPATLHVYSVAAWRPTRYAKLTPEQALAFARALLAACDAGAAAASEPYTLHVAVSSAGFVGGWLGTQAAELYASNAPRTALGDAYNAVSFAMVTLGTVDAFDTTTLTPLLLELANEMDNQGYLVTGQPFLPTLAGGLSSAAAAVGAWATSVAGAAVGSIAGAAANVLLSAPGLLVLGALVVIGPSNLVHAAKAAL